MICLVGLNEASKSLRDKVTAALGLDLEQLQKVADAVADEAEWPTIIKEPTS